MNGLKPEIYIQKNVSKFYSLAEANGTIVFDIFSEKFIDYKDELLNYCNYTSILNFCFKLSHSVKMDSTVSPYEILFSINKLSYDKQAIFETKQKPTA